MPLTVEPVTAPARAADAPAAADAPSTQPSIRDCSICLSKSDDMVILTCAHEFCGPCVTAWVAAGPAEPSCPPCRTLIHADHPGLRPGVAARAARARAAAAAAQEIEWRFTRAKIAVVAVLVISVTLGVSLD